MQSKLMNGMLGMTLACMLTGCETMQQHRGATTGAAVGAAAGAIAGSAIGSEGRRTESAIIGAIIGGVIGGAIGHYTYDQKRDREETVKQYSYEESQGNVLKIESLTATPPIVKAGGSVEIEMGYAILSPSDTKELVVTEIREIRQGEKLVGKPRIVVTRTDGTYESTVPVTLSANAVPGTYTVVATLQAGDHAASRQTTFDVR